MEGEIMGKESTSGCEIDIKHCYVNTINGFSTDWSRIQSLPLVARQTLHAIIGGADNSFGEGAEGAENFLNQISIDRVKFKVIQTKFDDGKMYEAFLVIRVEV